MTTRDKLAKAFRSTVLDKIEWQPVSVQPAEGTVSLVCLAIDGIAGRSAAAIFKGGEWVNAKGKALPFEPTNWMAWKE